MHDDFEFSDTLPPQGFQCFVKRAREEDDRFSIISQDDDTFHMDISSGPISKRARLQRHDEEDEEKYMTQSDIVSLASSEYTVPAQEAATAATDVGSRPWWKQAPKQKSDDDVSMNWCNENNNNPNNNGTLQCFVCESTFIPRHIPQETVDVMPVNSLLAYFPCKSVGPTAAFASKQKVVTPKQTKSSQLESSCTFCERSACPDCTQDCEECSQKFCKLCVTNDYYGSYARTVCLDCFRESERKQQEGDDDDDGSDDMKVDI